MFPGERMTDEEVAELFADCMDPEDEDGNVFYARESRSTETFCFVLCRSPVT